MAVHVAQAGERAEFAKAAQVAAFVDDQRGHRDVVAQAQQDVVGAQPVVSAPALQRDTQVGRAQRGAAQQPVAAPGQPAREPAQRRAVELPHRRAAQQFELRGGDAGLGPAQQERRDVRPSQGFRRVGAMPLEASHHRLHESEGRGGRPAGWRRHGLGARVQFVLGWHDMQPIWRQRRSRCP